MYRFCAGFFHFIKTSDHLQLHKGAFNILHKLANMSNAVYKGSIQILTDCISGSNMGGNKFIYIYIYIHFIYIYI